MNDKSSLPQDPKVDIYQTAGSNHNNVYVVWSDNSTGNGDIYFKRSLDNGSLLFAKQINIAKNNGSSVSPQIATAGNGNGNNVYVVWSDNSTGNGDIYFRRSLDNGASFETSKNLSNNPGNSSDPHILVDQGNVYVVWIDETTGNGDIYMKTSSIHEANAINFSRTKNLSKNNGSSVSPQIATAGNGNGNNVYVVWSDNSTGNGDIYFRRSLDNGDNFEGIDNLDQNMTTSSNPAIETSEEANVYVVWLGISSKMTTEIFLRASGDGGFSFDKLISLTKDSLRPSDTHLVSSQNGLYMVWIEEDRASTENSKVNFKRISEDFFDRNR
jgi:hypothetical protein